MLRIHYLLVTLLILGMNGACSSSNQKIPPSNKGTLYRDAHSMVSLCEAILDRQLSAKQAIEEHPLVDKMSQGMRPEVVFTPKEFAQAAFSTENDKRFSWKRLRTNAQYVRPFLDRLQRELPSRLEESLKIATEFLPLSLSSSQVTINLVCGSPWDAFVLIFKTPELFFDIGWQADQEPSLAMVDFQAILTHELWHLAFLEYQKKQWAKDYHNSNDAAALFLYEMINEGVGHYYTMHHQLYPKSSWPDFSSRMQKVFSLLEKNYAGYRTLEDVKERQKVLWRSHAGVPFWEKWGAVPGALMVYLLENEMGKKKLGSLFAKEPFSLVVVYDEHARRNPWWPKLPEVLVEDAKRLLETN